MPKTSLGTPTTETMETITGITATTTTVLSPIMPTTTDMAMGTITIIITTT